MEPDQFDQLARNAQVLSTRRTVVGTVAGAAAAVLGIIARPTNSDARRDSTQARRPQRNRRPGADGPCGDGGGGDNQCRRDHDCCTGICAKRHKRKVGRCRCRRRGQPCTQDRNCCRNGGQTLVCTAGTCGPPPPPPPACGDPGVLCCGDPDVPCRVFRTAQAFQGNLGGALGGDARCQTAATTAGLTGTYFAWLSDETTSPSERFYQSPEPYVLLDGTVIADNWADLTDGTIQNPIDRTEHNVVDVFRSWTGTNADGTLYTSDPATVSTCSNWTSSDSPENGVHGSNDDTNSQWTLWSFQLCSDSAPLYCFEQAPPG